MFNISKILIIILFFALLSSDVYAISLGSVVKSNVAETSNSESIKFTMLFWNVENESYTVKLSATDSPKDWTIIIDPNEFILNNSVGEEYIKLPYMDENAKAKVVNIFVKPDSNSKPGKYFISIKAEAIPQNEINDVAIIPEKLFRFEVNLKGFTMSNDNIENNIEYSKGELKVENPKINNLKIENKINKEYFYFIVISLVILTSIIIYKKS